MQSTADKIKHLQERIRELEGVAKEEVRSLLSKKSQRNVIFSWDTSLAAKKNTYFPAPKGPEILEMSRTIFFLVRAWKRKIRSTCWTEPWRSTRGRQLRRRGRWRTGKQPRGGAADSSSCNCSNSGSRRRGWRTCRRNLYVKFQRVSVIKPFLCHLCVDNIQFQQLAHEWASQNHNALTEYKDPRISGQPETSQRGGWRKSVWPGTGEGGVERRKGMNKSNCQEGEVQVGCFPPSNQPAILPFKLSLILIFSPPPHLPNRNFLLTYNDNFFVHLKLEIVIIVTSFSWDKNEAKGTKPFECWSQQLHLSTPQMLEPFLTLGLRKVSCFLSHFGHRLRATVTLLLWAWFFNAFHSARSFWRERKGVDVLLSCSLLKQTPKQQNTIVTFSCYFTSLSVAFGHSKSSKTSSTFLMAKEWTKMGPSVHLCQMLCCVFVASFVVSGKLAQSPTPLGKIQKGT